MADALDKNDTLLYVNLLDTFMTLTETLIQEIIDGQCKSK